MAMGYALTVKLFVFFLCHDNRPASRKEWKKVQISTTSTFLPVMVTDNWIFVKKK